MLVLLERRLLPLRVLSSLRRVVREQLIILLLLLLLKLLAPMVLTLVFWPSRLCLLVELFSLLSKRLKLLALRSWLV
jgi:hypothetical protein